MYTPATHSAHGETEGQSGEGAGLDPLSCCCLGGTQKGAGMRGKKTQILVKPLPSLSFVTLSM